VSAISDFSSSVPQAATSSFEQMTSEDFIRVMFAELTRQDPTKPTDSKDLLAQLGTIRSIESDLSLTRRLEEITKQNEITSAGSLVGQFAEGKVNGITTRGFVDSVSITRTGIHLNLSSGFTIALSNLEKLFDPALIQPVPPPSDTGDTGGDDGTDETDTGADS